MADLYSNCVILEFTKPLSRAQVEEVRDRIRYKPEGSVVSLPLLHEYVCAEREGNVAVPTIAADEC